MKSISLKWVVTFISGLILFLGTYYFAMDFEYISYDVTDKGQFVMHDGLNEPAPIINTDVSNEKEGLAELGTQMERFNWWVLASMIAAPLFIATYYVLLSNHEAWNQTIRKRYLKLTILINVGVAAVFIVQWIRYAHIINESMHILFFK
ncbi:hypothetical protein LF817_09350 [Halobacillus sp. A1]|uniref:hypothetical protein n=1 Tax=Halobacillus sp. A1 TaxID=2880262 RepID=UPI0020A6677E|nr:hypothetical protein [Halobacillus sp. A1]MCP3031554.1 hypothetical protein [Halobacillus sp. A1]